MPDQVYGIDLGTTYSAVALVDDDLKLPQIVKHFSGQDTTPSVVYFEEDGRIVVGSQAKQIQVSDPENACSLIKRHMGEEYPLEFRGSSHTPESISALILKELVNSANGQTGLDIHKVVITVPAYFGIQARQATKQAGEIAGLDVVGIVPEPVAAAITLGTKDEREQTMLIFDLGGGTFDTTVLKARAGNVDVITIDGNRLLGGADWDKRLEDLFMQKFVAEAGLGDENPSLDDDFVIELKTKVEEAKVTLTWRTSTKLLLRYADTKVNVEVTRAEFETATADLVAQTVEITKRVIVAAQNKVPGLSIDRFLLVGGSSRMPMVKQALTSAGWTPEDTDFDLSVAKGAAVFGELPIPVPFPEPPDGESTASEDSIPGVSPRRTIVRNVLSRGLGVLLVRKGLDGSYEEYVEFLAHTNDSLPLTASMRGRILYDGQSTVEVGLFEQGGETESERPDDNKPMASGPATTIEGLSGMREGDPIDIDLAVTAEGIARLAVREPKSGRSFKAEVDVSVLSAQDVAKFKERIALMPTES